MKTTLTIRDEAVECMPNIDQLKWVIAAWYMLNMWLVDSKQVTFFCLLA